MKEKLSIDKKKSIFNCGVANGVVSAINWGTDTVLIGILISMISNIDVIK